MLSLRWTVNSPPVRLPHPILELGAPQAGLAVAAADKKQSSIGATAKCASTERNCGFGGRNGTQYAKA